MARQQPIELFMPPNMLKAKAGGGLGGLDMAAMKRAETAMDTLKSQFSGWAASDVKTLMDARTAYAKNPAQGRDALMRAAHDIKGNAPTFNFPLIARVAGSLARLIGELPASQTLPSSLVDAHVNAVLVIHKQNIQTTDDKVAQALCAELDARVEETLKAAAKS
jgi:HPt (histidine-containing phosphotransfer) domain-containing protein